MSSMLPPSIILPPETAPDEPFGSQMPTVNPSTGLNPYFDQFNQMQQGFQSTMQDIQNDPFPLLEQYLGRQAQSNIEQTLQPMQQQAQEKISGVMSGIRSLVSEAFPNSGGMSTMGQLGSGTLSGGSNSITQPTSPAPFTPTIPPSDMGYPTIDLSQISTPAPLLGGGGFNPDGGVPVTGKAPYPPQIGFGGDPNAPQMDYTPEQIGNLLSQTPQSNPMAGGPMMDIISAQKTALGEQPQLSFDNSIAEQKYFGDQLMGESIKEGGVDPSSVGLGGNPILMGPQITPDMQGNFIDAATLDPSNPASPAYNPAMEYNLQAPLPQQDPLINLAYNYNMENSPY